LPVERDRKTDDFEFASVLGGFYQSTLSHVQHPSDSLASQL
jgi:hypothetical protein